MFQLKEFSQNESLRSFEIPDHRRQEVLEHRKLGTFSGLVSTKVTCIKCVSKCNYLS